MASVKAQIREARRPEEPPASEHLEFGTLWRPAEGAGVLRGPETVLLAQGRVTAEQVQHAWERMREDARLTVLSALVKMGVIEEHDALQGTATYFQLPFLRISPADVDPEMLELLPVAYLKAKRVLPLGWQDESIVVAIVDPADIFLIDDIKRRIRRPIALVVSPPGDILRAIEDLTADDSQQVDEIIKDITEDAVEVLERKSEEVADLERSAGESPVIKYVNYMIAQAVKDEASDIHIEPHENRLRIRCRIDGMLFDQQAPPLSMHPAIISRLKIMANQDIAERRLPQDGRIRATVHGRTIDLRVSTLPIIHGEKCVIRILDNRSILVGLENLGMREGTLERFRHHILQPHGIVLVTGPTGSGKSTTLYSALQVMDGDTLNVSTVEDPVEYELDFVNQVGVHETIGMTFSAALRSLLRQDPDVIMLGEIRDDETARIAVQAALTGHLVLSTLHTNDAPSSITRLGNIGVEPFLISAAVNAVLAQRLVRKICSNCKVEVTDVSDAEKRRLERAELPADRLWKGAGCERCRQTGYKGRMGVYELMEVTGPMREIITSNPDLGALRKAALESGMQTLQQDGFLKVAAGETTVEEILRATET